MKSNSMSNQCFCSEKQLQGLHAQHGESKQELAHLNSSLQAERKVGITPAVWKQWFCRRGWKNPAS
jgi:hypothetical protein